MMQSTAHRHTRSASRLVFVVLAFAVLANTSTFHAQEVIWSEYFDGLDVNDGITSRSSNLQTYDGPSNKWIISTVDCDYFKKTTSSGYLETRDADGGAIWESEAISTNASGGLELDVKITQTQSNRLDPNDFYRVSVSYDNGLTYSEIAYQQDDFNEANLLEALKPSASTRVRIEFESQNNNEGYRLWKVVVKECADPNTFYLDGDNDTFGNPNGAVSYCGDSLPGYVSDNTDCDDADSEINPDTAWYLDSDGDGFGDSNTSVNNCVAPSGYVSLGGDCDDDDANVAPSIYYEDADSDGLGDPNSTIYGCSQPSGYVGDSSDTDPTVDNNDYNGTVLYPGDVYLSYGTDGKADAGSEQEVYIGFIVLKDVAEGTEIIVSPKLYWKDDKWNDAKKVEIRWTAPTGGVSAGTEVILFDVKDNANTGSAYRSAEGNPIVANGTQTQLTGGVLCGSFEHLGDEREDFKGRDVIWLFQPNTGWDPNDAGDESVDSKCRHLNCIGKNLDSNDNTGSGTLISGDDWSAQMSSNYSYQNSSLFNDETWAYNGGTTVGAFAISGTSLSSQSLSEGSSFSADDTTPSFDSDNDDRDITINPNGSLTQTSQATWTELAESSLVTSAGAVELDITLDEDVTLTINTAEDVACSDVNVSAGTFCACDGAGRTLKVNGNVSLGASGSITGGTGRLQLEGLASQILDANNYDESENERLSLSILQILNNKTATIKGHVKIQPGGALEFDDDESTDDKLALSAEAASSLTFQSSASGTAAIGPCSADNFASGESQEFTFQRYIPADPDGSSWVNIGAYVTGTTVGDWTSANPSMLVFQYNESNYGSLGAGWTYLWDASTVLAPGSGYMALIPQGQDALFKVTGPFKMGDVTIDLTFTDDPNQSDVTVDGWNLVSNPYPSPVNLVQVLSRVDGVEAYYIYDNTNAGSYITSNDVGVGDAPSTLDVGQSFWVKVSENQILTFTEADKVAESNTFIREYDEGFEGSFGVSVANGDHQWSRAFIQFQEGSTSAYSTDEDALMYGDGATGDVFLWTKAESGEKLSIQSLGSRAEVTSVPLTLTTGTDGTIRFTQHAHETAVEDICGVIEDMETGEFMQLHAHDTLEVELTANTEYNDRFVLHFTPVPTMEWQSTACDGLAIDLAGENWEAWNANWFANDSTASGTGLPYELEDGEYTFEFTLPGTVCVQSVQVDVTTACLGDFNLNGERDVVDLLVILSGLPGGALETAFSEEADCDCDGFVTINDMLTFLTVFGTSCDQ